MPETTYIVIVGAPRNLWTPQNIHRPELVFLTFQEFSWITDITPAVGAIWVYKYNIPTWIKLKLKSPVIAKKVKLLDLESIQLQITQCNPASSKSISPFRPTNRYPLACQSLSAGWCELTGQHGNRKNSLSGHAAQSLVKFQGKGYRNMTEVIQTLHAAGKLPSLKVLTELVRKENPFITPYSIKCAYMRRNSSHIVT